MANWINHFILVQRRKISAITEQKNSKNIHFFFFFLRRNKNLKDTNKTEEKNTIHLLALEIKTLSERQSIELKRFKVIFEFEKKKNRAKEDTKVLNLTLTIKNYLFVITRAWNDRCISGKYFVSVFFLFDDHKMTYYMEMVDDCSQTAWKILKRIWNQRKISRLDWREFQCN